MSSASAVPGRIVAGRTPEHVYTPASLDELRTLVARDDGLTLVPSGGGTRLELGNGAERAFAIVELGAALSGAVEHEPDDMTIVVPAGLTISAINEAIRPSGQRLALDPPLPERATIGGTIACGSAGPLRVRYGLPRDAILGMTVLRSDGELVRAGGRVVKNVTGYDLMRLWAGSLGTLGILTSASLRVFPIPETVEIAVRGLKRREALEMANAAYVSDCRPEIAEVLREDDRWTLLLRVAAVLADRTRAIAPGTIAESWLGLYRAARDLGFDAEDELTIRVASPRKDLDAVAAQVETLQPSGIVLRPLANGLVASWTAATLAPLRQVEPLFAGLRSQLAASGGSLILERMPRSWRTDIDSWGEPPAAFPIMQRLKAAYDARGRLNAGRFIGGI